MSSIQTNEQFAPTLPNLAALPSGTQLMVAHFLDYNTPDLMIASDDADFPDLLATGWMQRSPTAPPGFVCFQFSHFAWHELLDLRQRFLSTAIRTQLRNYRSRKSTEYPWCW